MSRENVEWARRAYAAFNRGDVAAGVEDFAPEFEWVGRYGNEPRKPPLADSPRWDAVPDPSDEDYFED